MRQTISAVVASLAVLSASACSSSTTPPAEGNAVLNYINIGTSRAIYGTGGKPDANKYGGTVLDGTQGTHVKCSVRLSGGRYSVVASIEDSEMSLDVNSEDIGACSRGDSPEGCASMAFLVQGRADTERSVDERNDPAPTCTISTSQANTKYGVEPGSIFAGYDCKNVQTPTNPGNGTWTQGIFLFTGCDK